MTQALEIGKKLIDLCRKGEYELAITELYADDATHREAYAMDPNMPQVTSGREQILKSAKQWAESNEIHASESKGPYPHGEDRFAVWMSIDITPKVGPMAGNRMKMEEVCLYQVQDGKISQVDFFWDPTGCDQ